MKYIYISKKKKLRNCIKYRYSKFLVFFSDFFFFSDSMPKIKNVNTIDEKKNNNNFFEIFNTSLI